MGKGVPGPPVVTPRGGALGRQGLLALAPPAQDGVVLLSGGNPQIAKGYGDEPVQAYLAATHDGQVAEPVQRAGGREQTGESE